MRKIGDLDWHQLSMWDCSPKHCVETYVQSSCGKHEFHYYLRRMTEIVSDSGWKVETVTSVEDVPKDVLRWKNGQVYVKNGNRTQKVVV
jgi:hypothetical protein